MPDIGWVVVSKPLMNSRVHPYTRYPSHHLPFPSPAGLALLLQLQVMRCVPVSIRSAQACLDSASSPSSVRPAGKEAKNTS